MSVHQAAAPHINTNAATHEALPVQHSNESSSVWSRVCSLTSSAASAIVSRVPRTPQQALHNAVNNTGRILGGVRDAGVYVATGAVALYQAQRADACQLTATPASGDACCFVPGGVDAATCVDALRQGYKGTVVTQAQVSALKTAGAITQAAANYILYGQGSNPYQSSTTASPDGTTSSPTSHEADFKKATIALAVLAGTAATVGLFMWVRSCCRAPDMHRKACGDLKAELQAQKAELEQLVPSADSAKKTDCDNYGTSVNQSVKNGGTREVYQLIGQLDSAIIELDTPKNVSSARLDALRKLKVDTATKLSNSADAIGGLKKAIGDVKNPQLARQVQQLQVQLRQQQGNPSQHPPQLLSLTSEAFSNPMFGADTNTNEASFMLSQSHSSSDDESDAESALTVRHRPELVASLTDDDFDETASHPTQFAEASRTEGRAPSPPPRTQTVRRSGYAETRFPASSSAYSVPSRGRGRGAELSTGGSHHQASSSQRVLSLQDTPQLHESADDN